VASNLGGQVIRLEAAAKPEAPRSLSWSLPTRGCSLGLT
jgi:hypothetical protein